MSKKLTWIEIAALYIGIIMGAGFASGRECWQFFGVFGKQGYYGAVVVLIGFVVLGLMLTYIAKSKSTSDLGQLVSPFEADWISKIIGYILAAFFYFDIVVMSSAGGSLLNQQFGISKIYGGLIITFLVLFTVLGNFDRISSVFRYLVPVLFSAAILMIVLIIRADFPPTEPPEFEPGHMTPTWLISAFVFLSYNGIALITMAGNSALRAKNSRNAYIGSLIGSTALGLLIIALMIALTRDMAFTAKLDLPMLGYSARLNPIINAVYAIILFGSVYSTGCSCFYAFTTVIPEEPWKNTFVVFSAFAGFSLSLLGFKKMIEYIYPMQGYIGLVFLVLIVINFFNELVKNKRN